MAIQGTRIWGDPNTGDAQPSKYVYWDYTNVLVKGDGGAVTTNEDGYITDILVFCRTDSGGSPGGNALAQVALYSGTSLLTNTADLTLGGGLGFQGQNYGNGPFPHIGAGVSIVGAVWVRGGGHLYIQGFTSGDGYHVDTSSGGWTNPFGGTSKTGWGALGWYCHYFPSCQVSGLTATPVSAGQSFAISGQSFSSGVSSVKVNGVTCPSWMVNSDTSITATVPAGATTGPVSVATQAGTGTSAASLLISGGYVIRSGSPSAAQEVAVIRTGSPVQSQGVYRYVVGQGWVTSQ